MNGTFCTIIGITTLSLIMTSWVSKHGILSILVKIYKWSIPIHHEKNAIFTYSFSNFESFIIIKPSKTQIVVYLIVC